LPAHATRPCSSARDNPPVTSRSSDVGSFVTSSQHRSGVMSSSEKTPKLDSLRRQLSSHQDRVVWSIAHECHRGDYYQVVRNRCRGRGRLFGDHLCARQVDDLSATGSRTRQALKPLRPVTGRTSSASANACDRLMAEALETAADRMVAREAAARLAGELAAVQARPWWRRSAGLREFRPVA
jgi:hypothetical protein